MKKLTHVCHKYYCEVCGLYASCQHVINEILSHVGHNHTGLGI